MKRITIRCPEYLHHRLVSYAKKQHRSLHAQLITFLEEMVKSKEGKAHKRESKSQSVEE
jgi:predicted HicB family RNase H-like nuclease